MNGTVLAAVQTARRVELCNAALVKALFTHPLLTLKVIGGIHWEALRLWAKGVRLVPRPPAPDLPVSMIVERASFHAETGRG